MMKAKMLLAVPVMILAICLVGAPASWANSLTFQNVTFNMTLNASGNLALNVVNALNPEVVILGGALGNLWDRIVIGRVTDFLLFQYAGWAWPAFNVADSAITVGAALLILDSFRDHGRSKA